LILAHVIAPHFVAGFETEIQRQAPFVPLPPGKQNRSQSLKKD
jgi:hypothetical protein